jgi:hypothetical protein
LQVVDSYRYCLDALLTGNPAKALFRKALASLAGKYQQSYPQIYWMKSKVLTDQVLKPHFTSSLQQQDPTRNRYDASAFGPGPDPGIQPGERATDLQK